MFFFCIWNFDAFFSWSWPLWALRLIPLIIPFSLNACLWQIWYIGHSFALVFIYLANRLQRLKIANCFYIFYIFFKYFLWCSPALCSGTNFITSVSFTTPLSSVIKNLNLDHNLYVDDTHNLLSLSTNDTERSSLGIIFMILHWITENRLKLANKTEFLMFGT